MSYITWTIIIGWPVLVVLVNNLLDYYQNQHMAKTTATAFNNTGLALQHTLDAIRDIELELGKLGATISTPIDSRGTVR